MKQTLIWIIDELNDGEKSIIQLALICNASRSVIDDLILYFYYGSWGSPVKVVTPFFRMPGKRSISGFLR